MEKRAPDEAEDKTKSINLTEKKIEVEIHTTIRTASIILLTGVAEASVEGLSVVWIEVGQNVVSSGASLDASIKGVPDRFVTEGVERSSVP